MLRPDEYYIWSTHAKITHVNQSKNTGNTTVYFRFTNNSKYRPPELSTTNSKQRCSVEILQKSALDQRVECALMFLDKSSILARVIAQRLDIPEYDKDHSHIKAITKSDVDIGLPTNNKKQKAAVLMALRHRFSLIHGPPGTGKTNTAIKLVYLFNEINRRLELKGEDKKRILFCGPSNKSVDLVAVRLLEKYNKDSPKIARLYGGSLANHDFPIPGKFYSNKKGSGDEKPDQKLKSVSVHWLIRESGKPYASEINEFEEQLKDSSKLCVDLIKEYTEIVAKATRQELKNYDVIFCTTAMSTNSVVFGDIKDQIYQLIIDECGMCTEPECVATIVATRAKHVVLIGDHKQLRPIVQCQQAEHLGLQKSLFERYHKCGFKDIVQLNTQYRMHESICDFPSKDFYSKSLHTGKSDSYVEDPPLLIWGEKVKKRHVFCHVEGEEEMLTVSTGDGNIMSRSNELEIRQVVKIFKFLHKHEGIFGVKKNNIKPKCSINIMSQYNAQCKAVTKALEKEGFDNVNVNTINGSQGGEWDYVILSLVRSLPEIRIERYPTLGWCKRNLGAIIEENLINVALTRAKKGLFIVGNKKLLSCNEVWKRLINDYGAHGCVFDAEEFPMPLKRNQNKKKGKKG